MTRFHVAIVLVFMALALVACRPEPESLLALRDVQSYYAGRPLPHAWRMDQVSLREGRIHVHVVENSQRQIDFLLALPVMRRFQFLHGVCPTDARVWRNFVNEKRMAVVLLGPDGRPVETAHCRSLT